MTQPDQNRDSDTDTDDDRDQTTRPSLRQGDGPIAPSGSARQPVHDSRTTPGAASGDPTE